MIVTKEMRSSAIQKVASGQSRRAVARSLGVSNVTVGRWCNAAADGKLDEMTVTQSEAAIKGWEGRHAQIAANWESLAVECQELALRAVRAEGGGVIDQLQYLGGSAPLKSIITSAAIATDKAMLARGHIRSTLTMEVREEAMTQPPSAAGIAVARACAILDEHGPFVADDTLNELLDAVERHLLGAG